VRLNIQSLTQNAFVWLVLPSKQALQAPITLKKLKIAIQLAVTACPGDATFTTRRQASVACKTLQHALVGVITNEQSIIKAG